MRATRQKDDDISKVVYPFRQEQRERLDLIDCFVREWCENEEIDKNVFFLMKLNRLLGDSKSPEFSKAMANILGRYPEIVAKLTEMAFDGYALALQVFLFLVDSENVVKLMIEHKLIQFLIELTEKSDHPFIPILCLQILGGIGRLPEFVRYISTDECVECAIACVDLTVPCCKRDAMSEKYPVYQEDVFSSFTASQSIPVSTSITNMIPSPITESNTPSSSVGQLPLSQYSASIQQPTGKTGGKDQMGFINQNSNTSNQLLNAGQTQNSLKPLDLPAVAVCKFGIDLLHLFVENNDKMACKPIWQKMIASLKAATRRIELPVPVRKQAHAVLVTAKQTEFIQLVFAKPNTKAGGISITSSSSSGK